MGIGKNNLFFSINLSNFSIISLNVSSSGPTHSIILSFVSFSIKSSTVSVIIFKTFSLSFVLMMDSTVAFLSSSESGLEFLLFHLVVSRCIWSTKKPLPKRLSIVYDYINDNYEKIEEIENWYILKKIN